MSRGGTKKARQEQERRRKTRERAEAKVTKEKKKADRREKPKGKGRAALLHLSGFPAPAIVALGLLLSGNVGIGGDAPSAEYWARTLIGDANAPYWKEPGGLLLAGSVLALGFALFLVSPISAWRYAYRDHHVIDRDRTSVDNSFTMLALGVLAWIVRIAIGYSTTFNTVAGMLLGLTIYVPVFSALLALVFPPVPGMGRIGGVLPDFMKIPFTEKVLIDDEDRDVVRAATTAAKESVRAGRARK